MGCIPYKALDNTPNLPKAKAVQLALNRPNLLTKHGTNHEVSYRNAELCFSN